LHRICGDGKSDLDGLFGVAGGELQRAVDAGFSYYDAETVAEALTRRGGLAKTVVAVFEAVRQEPKLKAPANKLGAFEGLDSFHHSRLEWSGATLIGLRCFKHSGHGAGRLQLHPTRPADVPDPSDLRRSLCDRGCEIRRQRSACSDRYSQSHPRGFAGRFLLGGLRVQRFR
jgi:hypothetical protein